MLRLLGLLVGSMLAYALAALLLGLIPVNERLPPDKAATEVMLYTTGVHLDICLPVRSAAYDWRDWLPPADFGLSPEAVSYVAFGWGDSSFYVSTPTWDDLELGVAARAIGWPTPSALHVSYLRAAPTQLPGFVRVPVTAAQLAALTSYVQATFARDSSGRPMRFRGSDYPPHPDAFYRAVPAYHAFHTCNDWVNRGLKQADIRAVIWTPVDRLVLRQF